MFSGVQSSAGDELVSGLVKDSFGALPLDHIRGHIIHHDIPSWSPPPSWQRAVFSLLTLIPLLITMGLFVRRYRNLAQGRIRHMSYIRHLVMLSYILAIAFSFSSFSLVWSGIKTLGLCRNAIYLCVGFLYAGKLAMQLFLIERAHVANINYLRRRDDPVWWVNMIFSAVAVIALTVWTYLNPVYFMSPEDGRCRNGLPPNVVGPLQAYELVLNTILTINFLRLLKRAKQVRTKQQAMVGRPLQSFDESKEEIAPNSVPERSTRPPLGSHRTTFDSIATQMANFRIIPVPSVMTVPGEKMDGAQAVDLESAHIVLPASKGQTRLRNLARKSLVGTLLMLCWSLANNIIFYVTKGRENAWVCFIQCNFDVILSVFVLHWLTTDTVEGDLKTNNDSRSAFGSGSCPRSRHASIMTPIPSARERPSFPRRDSYAKWGSRRDTEISNMDEVVLPGPTSRRTSAAVEQQASETEEEPTALSQVPMAVLALKAWERRRSSASTAFGQGSSGRGSIA